MVFRFSKMAGKQCQNPKSDICRSAYAIRILLPISILCMLIIGIAGEAFAQAPGPPGPQGGQPSQNDMRVVERGQDGKATKISFFNVVNVNIHDILKFMSDETNLTIIASDKVQGKITIVNLKGITVDEALEALRTALNTLGFTTVRVNKTLVIIPITDAKTRPLRVQIGADPNLIESSD